jgi:divalent metal cation (Fe/Co/Zn/Cd) transporter
MHTSQQHRDEMEFKFFLQKMQEQSARHRIILVESVSIGLTILCALLTGYLALVDYSTAALAIAIDSFIDILAYSVIIWRYMRSEQINSDKRDSRATLILAVLFIFSAVCIEFEAIKNLILEIKPVPSGMFILASVLESVTFSILSITKFMIAQRLISSNALTTSGINSLICSFSYLSMAISMSTYVLFPSIWYLDSLFGFCIGVLVFGYGISSFWKYTCSPIPD